MMEGRMMSYLEKVKEIVHFGKLYSMNVNDLWEILDEAKPIIFDGHFELLCGRHSDKFFRFAEIAQFPYFMSMISREMIAWFKDEVGEELKANVALSPSSAGLILAYDIARELNGYSGMRAVQTLCDQETGKPIPELANGFEIRRGEKVLIVNDVTTTGKGVETLIDVAKDNGGEVIGICLFANRGKDVAEVKNLKKEYGEKFHAIIELDMESYEVDEDGKCPICLSREPKVLIQSKQINHLPLYSTENEYNLYVKKLEAA
jgi:orotate phosphoribosyltransferase